MRSVLLFFLICTSAAKANEVSWVILMPRFSYQDLSVACSSKYSEHSRYLAMEIENGKVRKAVIHTDTSPSLSFYPLVLTSQELAKWEVIQDDDKKWWVKSLPLSARGLGWFFYHAGSCAPSQPLLTVSPGEFTFEFDTPLGVSYSTLGSFFGKRKDGGPYSAQLEFFQIPYKPQ